MTPERAFPLWLPDPERAADSVMQRFFRSASTRPGAPAPDAPYTAWHAWSVAHPEHFWRALYHFGQVQGEHYRPETPSERISSADFGPEDILERGDLMAPPAAAGRPGPRWFRRTHLNYAERVISADGDTLAIVARDETGRRRQLTRTELSDAVRRCAGAFRAAGVERGDRVVGFLPNIPEAVVAALAAASIGAVWSSCSPDFGVGGVLDRFGQIAPKVLIVADGYRYGGKRIDCIARTAEIVAALPSVEQLVVVPFLGDAAATAARAERLPTSTTWDAFLERGTDAPLVFERVPFDHPLFIMYSSGTTGLPKCMVHGHGGTILQHLKEHLLHGDLQLGERIFYFTTCGWMMWNWLLSALAAYATIILYDGAPLPDANPAILWDLAAEEEVAVFGTSAKFLAMSEKLGLAPARTHDLRALRMILSTGSPLAEHSYDYVVHDVKPGVHLASISGGTDLISCFALGNPLLPVWRGELQCLGLGMAVEVLDSDGDPVRGEAGELVCTRPFPSMPVAFWNDPDGAKYRAAYFDVFPGVWRHGDWAEITAHDGLIIHGRSDATLNPGGVRIGTAEIYRQVEQLPEVLESVVIGQDVGSGTEKDVRIVLFVRLRDDLLLDDALRARIRAAIREATSPHHVPKVIEQVADIPRTISGKISEIAVRDVVHGRPVKNTDALANPGSLALFRDLPALVV
ncbi:MAG: acetoacetate--CoA ligase [Gemmatimonadetes bacterium]|nr:acetoacetate--CoA ligase [Gemmatimonadota bacterium]